MVSCDMKTFENKIHFENSFKLFTNTLSSGCRGADRIPYIYIYLIWLKILGSVSILSSYSFLTIAVAAELLLLLIPEMLLLDDLARRHSRRRRRTLRGRGRRMRRNRQRHEMTELPPQLRRRRRRSVQTQDGVDRV